MAEQKTKPTEQSVETFIAKAVTDEKRAFKSMQGWTANLQREKRRMGFVPALSHSVAQRSRRRHKGNIKTTMNRKFLTTIIFLTSFASIYGQSITINTTEGRKTLYADKSKACNKDLVFMISAESPKFDNSNGEFADRLNALVNFDKSVKGEVIVWFVINCNGEPYGFQFIKGLNDEVNKRIIDGLTKLQSWSPGRQGGKPIDSVHNLKLEIKKGKIKS